VAEMILQLARVIAATSCAKPDGLAVFVGVM
jgi:hypothetical protein